jgi:hypothetical protein
MPVLTPQTEIILMDDGEWYREMMREGMLPATQDNGPSDVLLGKFVEQMLDGIWIDLPPNIAQLRSLLFSFLQRFIWSIVVGDLAERKKVGFKAASYVSNLAAPTRCLSRRQQIVKVAIQPAKCCLDKGFPSKAISRADSGPLFGSPSPIHSGDPLEAVVEKF